MSVCENRSQVCISMELFQTKLFFLLIPFYQMKSKWQNWKPCERHSASSNNKNNNKNSMKKSNCFQTAMKIDVCIFYSNLFTAELNAELASIMQSLTLHVLPSSRNPSEIPCFIQILQSTLWLTGCMILSSSQLSKCISFVWKKSFIFLAQSIYSFHF